MSFNFACRVRLWWFLLLLFLVSGTRSTLAVERINPGHVVKITVSGHPEFTGGFKVLQDGTIEYPLLAGIPIDGLTVDDLKDLLHSVLLRFELEPDIFVMISEHKIVKFQVFGEIQRPGSYEIEGRVNVQQALTMAGGPAENADYRHVRILRAGDGNQADLSINLRDYFKQDSLMLPPDVEDGDIIIIPYQRIDINVRVLGSVHDPGFYVVEDGDDLMDIIQKAGGMSRQADAKRVIHITNVSGRSVRNVVNVHELIQSGRYQDLPEISFGDVIIVPQKAEWRDIWLWISRWRDIIYFATSIFILDRYLH
ncbi:MAG TPA: hypothetical protein ENL08_02425 [Bacteroidetes bacterium]|nr:hypothetical protein [Bacteroidota bacterium]